MTDAFGIVAMVAMTPLITIQVMGLIYKIKMESYDETKSVAILDTEDSIIDYEEE